MVLYKEFSNQKYHVLEFIYKIGKKNDGVANITQQELADANNISKQTVNNIMVWLRDNGFILYMKRGKGYAITKKGEHIVEFMVSKIKV